MSLGDNRRERLATARLYLVTDAGMREAALDASLRGGVDMVQLRDRRSDDDALLAAAARFRAICERHDALLWVNDRPDLALRAGADGVHVGQDDASVADVRVEVGEDVLIGLSTHAPEQFDAGIESGADQLSVGPVWETPTKPGRPAAGLGYVRHAARRDPDVPWFAIGGIDAANIGEVVAAGARRVVVVRAVRDAPDPEVAAAGLLGVLEGAPVGSAQ
jgi:thiamine-phosphate pyrophosphorylase